MSAGAEKDDTQLFRIGSGEQFQLGHTQHNRSKVLESPQTALNKIVSIVVETQIVNIFFATSSGGLVVGTEVFIRKHHCRTVEVRAAAVSALLCARVPSGLLRRAPVALIYHM